MRAKIHSVAEFELEIQRLLEEVREESRADAVTFHYYDEEHDRLILPVAVGLFQETRFKSWLPSMSRVAGKIIRSGMPVIVEDAEHHSDMTGPFTYAEKIKSAAGLPLTATSGEKMGVLFVSYRTRHPFSRQEQAALADLAVQTADTIQSRLTKRLKADLSAHPGLPRLEIALQEIADGVTKALGDVAAAIWMPERDRQSLVIKAHSGPTGKFVRGTSLNLTQASAVTDAFKTGEPANASIDNEPAFKDEASLMRWREVWAFPMLSGSRVLGVLCIWTVGYYGLTEQEKARIGAFVELTARTIENEQRILTLNTLQSVGARLTFMLADPRLMSEIVKSAAQVMGADNITLHQYDPERRQFCDVDKSVTYRAPQPLQRPREEGGASAYVRDYGYVIIEDMDKPDEATRKMAWTKHVLEVGVKAYLGIRLRANEDTLGVLFFNYLQPRRFSPDEIAIAEIFADYAATAIHNARLFERAWARTQELGVLNEVGQALTSGIRLQQDKILELIYDQASKLMDTRLMYIALYDQDADMVSFGLAVEGGERVEVGEGTWAPRVAGHGATEAIIRSREPLLFRTAAKAKEWYAKPENEEYYGDIPDKFGFLGVPMMIGDKVRGVIAVRNWESDNVYDQADLTTLLTIATQAAIALDNATLYGDLQERIEELEGLQAVGLALTSESDLEGLLSQVTEKAAAVLEADMATVYQYDQATREFYLPIVVGSGVQPLPSKDGIAAKIVEGEKLIIAEDPLSHPLLKNSTFIRERGVKSCAAVPLKYGDRCVGILFINHLRAPYHFTRSDERIISMFADQAAIAINMAGLLYDAKRQLETVQEIIKAVEAHAKLPDYLQSILNLTLSKIGAQNGTIQLFDEATNELVIRAKAGELSRRSHEYERIPLTKGITGEAARERRTAYVPDVTQSDDYLPYIKGTRSEIAVPMMIGDEKLVGVLNVEHPDPNAFGPYSRGLLERIADQAAVLIQQKIEAEELEKKRLAAEVSAGVGLVTAEVAHHMKNLAGIIRPCAIRLRKQLPDLTPQQRKDLSSILLNAEDIMKAAEDLFKPFRPESKAGVGVALMLDEALGVIGEQPDIDIRVNLAPDLPKVSVQTRKVQSYIVELLGNAIKFTRKRMQEERLDREQIEVDGRLAEDDFIELAFTNHGPPIPRELWEEIFKLFSASETEEAREPQSYGLGLWGARTTMRMHGGDVYLLESNPQKTTFLMRLPTQQKRR